MRDGSAAYWDAVVAGSGPAALAATAALALEGLRVLRVGPPVRWSATYCCWWDEVVDAAAALRLGDPYALATRHDQPLVRTRAGGDVLLPRPYARLDDAALAAALRTRALGAGAVERRGRLAGVRGAGTSSVAVLADGTEVAGSLVVDATGGAANAPAQQRAWGEVVEGVPDLLPPGGALFMDWVAPGRDGPPAFLYGLDLGDGTSLLELTSLAARPPVALEQLRSQLHALLDERGIVRAGRSERVAIPLGRARVRSGAFAPALPFGAAAGMVHPATGYSVLSSLLLAPALARAAAGALGATGGRGPTDGGGAVEAARTALWPRGRRATAYLLDRGLEALLPLGAEDVDRFFAAFFALPQERWSAYLDLRSPPAAVAAAMSATFARLPAHLRLHVARATVAAPRH
ncbi:lycopene beta-cyclase [Motilibacter peucedani]|uniref:Lycopene beta-cyclase n=1 Tax=Motilibacter peucedani TaxID=598650 RepID=A0A420XJV0_9ACTN|nr:lycopene cyclase family protein [Motilibacter peucedani]RKS67896.1 lycopene beta-cyclase [Motilibacter peucedani]